MAIRDRFPSRGMKGEGGRYESATFASSRAVIRRSEPDGNAIERKEKGTVRRRCLDPTAVDGSKRDAIH